MVADGVDKGRDCGGVGQVGREGGSLDAPLRVSYRLTEAGGALEPALKELAAWAERHLPDAERATTSSGI
ncbi:winged helix-turn-helix transcriptional regulator [Streptomyces sp. NPDC001617]